jgi:hypothetical protein
MEEVLSRRFPPLPAQLASDLDKVPPSDDRGLLYYPCVVTLRDGSSRDFVYLAESRRWLRSWGPSFHSEPLGGRLIDVRDVIALKESLNRLPPVFANKLYEAGESGMGYTIFTVCFDDGSAVIYGTGNAVDFVRYPMGMSAGNVTNILPHEGRNEPGIRRTPDYCWCIFERP